MTKKITFTSVFMFLLLSICIPNDLLAQIQPTSGTTVTGKIRDGSGQALPGTTILEKDTQNGVIANSNGEFSIKLKGSSRTLIFSLIGFVSKSVTLQNNQSLLVELDASSNALNDVVVVGYTQRRKVDLTGAVASVSSKELENRPVTNVAQALQGQVANLNVTPNAYGAGGAPDAEPNINVRGFTGFGVLAAPLVVIDGIPGGDLNSINPSDIDNISLLKDAASSAIYGSSAPYGVLLVTTKRGKEGKPTINYSNNLSISQAINLPKMVNSLDFANLFNEAFVNAGRAPWYNQETLGRIKGYLDGTLKDETIKDPNHDDWYGSGLGYFTGAGPNTGNGNNDWFKIYFKPWAFSQQHNLSVSGGSKSTSYYLGAGYTSKGGMYNFMSDSYSRSNVRANVSTEINKWLTVNFRSALSRQSGNTPATYPDATGGNYMHQIARKLPTTPLFNPDGEYSDYSGVKLFTEGGRNTYDKDKVNATGELVIKPATGWNITGNFTYNGTYFNSKNFNKVVYTIQPSGNKVPEFQTNPNNSLEESYGTNADYVTNIFSSYEKKINNHYFQILGGYIKDFRANKMLYASNSLLYSNDIPSLNLTYNPSPSVADNDTRLAMEGYFGRFNYNYKDKYLLELNGRYDASSRFLENKRWNLYSGLSGGYVVSEENFWKPLKNYVNLFKLRGSYGSLGDQWGDNPGQDNYYPFYPSLSTVAPTNTSWIFANGRQSYVGPPGLVNPSLTWATIKSLNMGVDMAFFNNKLSMSFDHYIRKATDFVGPSENLPSILGTAVPQANNASMQTKGFELTLGWNDKINDVNYYVRAVLSNSKSTVQKYPNTTKLLSDWYEGMVMGEIWGYETQGLFQSAQEIANAPKQTAINASNWTPGDVRYKDLNGDNVINFGNNTADNSGDRKVIGNSSPQYSYGVTVGGDWKGFDVSMFLQGVAKRDAWVGSDMYFGIIGGEWGSTVMTQNLNRWTPQTPDGFFPKYYMSGQMNKNIQTQTRYLQNAAYMRIKNIQLGYTVSKNLLSHVGIQKLRVYLSGDNLATFTKMQKSLDPELAVDEGKIYPLQRTLSFGLNVTF